MATKTEPKVENTLELNVFQKLLKARLRFLEANIKKSGVNRQLEYKYFDLDDIVPAVTRIGNELGLLFYCSFTNETATMTVINVDEIDEKIEFTSPMKEIPPRLSTKTGGEITNALQNLGSVETYQRRYLYLTALDIVESDTVDGDTIEKPASETITPKTTASAPKKATPTVAERADVKNDIVANDEQANTLQIRALKDSLKKLREVAPNEEEFIQAIALKTNSFTNIKKGAAETLIIKIGEMVEAYSAPMGVTNEVV